MTKVVPYDARSLKKIGCELSHSWGGGFKTKSVTSVTLFFFFYFDGFPYKFFFLHFETCLYKNLTKRWDETIEPEIQRCKLSVLQVTRLRVEFGVTIEL